ncbi:MAG: ShlB/FhaC/HecB family hemolysin secretion/activation protein, partial [Candidatus Aminicenantales bacterium]
MVNRRDFIKIGGLSLSLSGFVRGLAAQGPGGVPLENLVKGVQPTGPEDYEARQERARSLMAAHRLDAVFLNGGVNLSYFTTTLTNSGVASTTNFVIALPSNGREDVTYMPLSWGWSGERPDQRGSTSLSLEQDVFPWPLASSRPNFQTAAGSEAAGGNYTKVTANAAREEKLRAGWSILWRAAGQWASEPLISNEQFPLGGTAGVRGYQEGETYGDTGWRTTLDLRAPAAGIGSFPVGSGTVPALARPAVFMD